MMNNSQTTSRLPSLSVFFCSRASQNDIFIYQNKSFWSKHTVTFKWNSVVLIFLGFLLGIWLKFKLVLRLLISFNCIPNWPQTFNYMQFYRCRTPIPTLNFNAFLFWSLVLGLYKLTLNWSLNFQYTLISPLFSNKLSLWSLTSFSKKSLVMNLFNLTINWP